ncbi:MAG: 4Fe-4S dicluster domain-containing protein [Ilumatobacteraceae bacterium]
MTIEPGTRYGFFTDTSVCIGCKACEVACKEWNGIESEVAEMTGNSYDNTGSLDATTWRHVAFIEKSDRITPDLPTAMVWLMSSDVCKHCTEAACLDVCPTGSLVRTEFGSVVVQPDICNGCGYCVPACPFGVIGKNESDGRVGKCTLCYDRLKGGDQPACAQACPTQSIQFGRLDELRATAYERLDTLHDAGVAEARLYGHDPTDGIGGAGAMFLLLDAPDVYGLPPEPRTTTRDLPRMWRAAARSAAGLLVGIALVIAGDRS